MRLTVRRISRHPFKEANPIDEYRKTKSTHDISIRIADNLERYDPQNYHPANRARTVMEINDILQGRSERTIENLLDEVQKKFGEYGAKASAEIMSDVRNFQRQRQTLDYPYDRSNAKSYKFKTYNPDAERPLKIINQRLYDQAAKSGFTLDFFRESYFDNVTFYCLPDHADFNFSSLWNCSFAVCRIREANFDGTTMCDTTFHSCMIRYATFFNSTLAHTRFFDCDMENVSFHSGRLKSCRMMDCTMLNVGFMKSKLDGCSFDRVKAFCIRDLHTATITQGGATHEEVERNRKAIFAALRSENQGTRPMPQRTRGTR